MDRYRSDGGCDGISHPIWRVSADHLCTQPLTKSVLSSGSAVGLASSPADLARCSEVVFTMLSHPSDVESVVLDPNNGVLSAMPEGSIIIDTTSSHPELARQIASAAMSRNCCAMDAPVSGGDVGARQGKLAIFAGADESVVQSLLPLLELLGKVTYMGPPGSGQTAKIANQIAVTESILGLTEAMLFAQKAGLLDDDANALFSADEAKSTAPELFGQRIIRRELGPGGFAEYLVKDLGMALAAGDSVLPGTALFHQLYLGMVANGDAKLGSHGLISILERINAIAVPKEEDLRDGLN